MNYKYKLYHFASLAFAVPQRTASFGKYSIFKRKMLIESLLACHEKISWQFSFGTTNTASDCSNLLCFFSNRDMDHPTHCTILSEMSKRYEHHCRPFSSLAVLVNGMGMLA